MINMTRLIAAGLSVLLAGGCETASTPTANQTTHANVSEKQEVTFHVKDMGERLELL